jgi:pyrroloquinoline-quinone synthase
MSTSSSNAIESTCWTSEEFTAQLRQVGQSRYHDKHPFHQRMHRGELSKSEFKNWVLNRFYYQKNLPVKDALIVAKLPAREDRRKWLQRIIDHDGTVTDDGGIEAWLRLGEAAGLRRVDIEDDRNILPGVRFAVDAYVNYCRNQTWLLAVASSLTELFAPDLVSYRVQIIEQHYPWVSSSGLDYFKRRLHQAPRDADHALALVLANANTKNLQLQAISALNFKCDVLWSLLDAVAQGSI